MIACDVFLEVQLVIDRYQIIYILYLIKEIFGSRLTVLRGS